MFWRAAGELAVRRAGNREAIEHLRRALSLLKTQPETAERWRAELAVLSELSPALMSVHGWSAPEVGEAVERAAAVGRRLESSADLAPSIASLWIFNISRGQFGRADEISADLFRIAHELDDSQILLQAHHSAWSAQFLRGLFTEASEHVDAGARLYDEQRHAHHRYIYMGHDPAVCGLAARTGHAMGPRPPNTSNALRRPTASHGPETGACTLLDTCALVRLQFASGARRCSFRPCHCEAIVSGKRGARAFPSAGPALIFLGWALACGGDTTKGIPLLQEGLGFLDDIGARVFLTRSLCLMGEGLLAARHYGAGLERVDRAIEIAIQTGEHWYLSRLYRARAELLLRQGSADEAAETSLHQALHRSTTASCHRLGTAGRYAPRPAPPRPGSPRRSPRSPRAGLWLVHRRLRHARSQSGKGATRRAGVSR